MNGSTAPSLEKGQWGPGWDAHEGRVGEGQTKRGWQRLAVAVGLCARLGDWCDVCELWMCENADAAECLRRASYAMTGLTDCESELRGTLIEDREMAESREPSTRGSLPLLAPSPHDQRTFNGDMVAQIAKGVEDSPEVFANDIIAKTKGKVDQSLVTRLARESAHTIDWLMEDHAIELSLVEGFTYPGHSALRMHGMPTRSGNELMGALANACETAIIGT